MEKEEEKENNGGVIKKTRIWETVRKQASLEGFFLSKGQRVQKETGRNMRSWCLGKNRRLKGRKDKIKEGRLEGMKGEKPNGRSLEIAVSHMIQCTT